MIVANESKFITANEARQVSRDNSHRSFEIFRESVYDSICHSANDGFFWTFWRFDCHINTYNPIFVDDIIKDLISNGYKAYEDKCVLEDMHTHYGIMIEWMEHE